MKIKLIKKGYKEALASRREGHHNPIKPNLFFRTLMKMVSLPDMKKTHFKVTRIGMEKLGKRESALYLMNHSSFIDLEIVATVLYPRPFNIVATSDGFVGKGWLMRHIGCISTKKFVNDLTLIRDMDYAIKELHSNVVLFPEAGYSFDGTATALPDSLGKLVKHMGVPVVMIKTFGAYHRDPLYNNLQKRKIDVSATEEYILSPEEISEMSCEEISGIINREFSFDNFAWQKENHVKIDESFRADGLERVLYKCPHCMKEGEMEGAGTRLFCHACGASYTLDEYGALVKENGQGIFDHIPAWYAWQRESVREEIESGKYGENIDVDILVAFDTKHIYEVGEGALSHTESGFKLVGCNGELEYKQKPFASHTVNSDFNWYEIGDVIGIGNREALYYCVPKSKYVVAKIRLAAEELYKMLKEKAKPQEA